MRSAAFDDFSFKTQKKIKSNVLDVVCNGEKQTYKISTQHNYLKATDNHKLPIYDYNDNLFKEKYIWRNCDQHRYKNIYRTLDMFQ